MITFPTIKTCNSILKLFGFKDKEKIKFQMKYVVSFENVEGQKILRKFEKIKCQLKRDFAYLKLFSFKCGFALTVSKFLINTQYILILLKFET